jgi:hypothetical protein
MTSETKVKKQRRLMQNLEDKLIAYAEAGKTMEEKFLPELQAKKIESLFESSGLSHDELRNMQIAVFARMVQAEQRLEFIKHVYNDILSEIWELKKAIHEKQRGGPKRKVPLNVVADVYTRIGRETKAFPKKNEFTARLNHVLTGSRESDADGKFALNDKTFDNYIKIMKICMVESYAESLKANKLLRCIAKSH